jgi:hypothetical protein
MKMKHPAFVPATYTTEKGITDTLGSSDGKPTRDVQLLGKALGRELFNSFMAKMAASQPRRLIYN